MAKSNGSGTRRDGSPGPALSRITVAGFKSIGSERSIDIRPLTLLAGANSSGKSSMMQPLLLFKQTLEAPYDPGALLLDGPNVRFTNFEQMLYRSGKHSPNETFSVGLAADGEYPASVRFCRGNGYPADVESMTVEKPGDTVVLRPGRINLDPESLFSEPMMMYYIKTVRRERRSLSTTIVRQRCFLEARVTVTAISGEEVDFGHPFTVRIAQILVDSIHLPGLRGNPRRTYPVAAVGPPFTGTFENYVASIIAKATNEKSDLLNRIGDDLRILGLTWKVAASPIDDTQVELRVGRLSQPARGGAHDLVNIADVGFGVSQTLPVVVALQVARPGQLVYIEQPEIHLHPAPRWRWPAC